MGKSVAGDRRRETGRFSPQQVREIRARVAAGESQRQVGLEYGVSNETIRDIINGRTYWYID